MMGILRACLCLLVLASVVACDKPVEPEAVPGTLTVQLTSPHSDDAAILLRLTGPVPASKLQGLDPRHVMHSRVEGQEVTVVVFGPLSNGGLLRFFVPDINRAPEYSATVVEVADEENDLRTPVEAYVLTIH